MQLNEKTTAKYAVIDVPKHRTMSLLWGAPDPTKPVTHNTIAGLSYMTEPNWPQYLTDAERARLEEIEAARSALTAERQRLHNKAKQRKHRAEK